MQKENNLSETLQEVRASYRLLYNFQKRVLDLVYYIGTKYGYTYLGGFPKYSNPAPKRGKGHLENWAWDWLNMYYYEFGFNRKKVNNKDLCFSVFLLADNGHYEVRENGVGKLDTANFLDVKKAKTELIFVVGWGMWKPCWGINGSWDWDRDDFLLAESNKQNDDAGNVMFHKHYNLERFETEEGATNVIRDFLAECDKLHIPLSITSQIIK